MRPRDITCLEFGILENPERPNRSDLIAAAIKTFRNIKVKRLTAASDEKRKIQYFLRNIQEFATCDFIFLRTPHNIVTLCFAALAKFVFKRPVISDGLLSSFEGQIVDRGLAGRFSLRATLAHAEDRLLGRISDIIITDTHQHRRLLQHLYRVPISRLVIIPVGSPLAELCGIVSARDLNDAPSDEENKIKVLYIGNYVPLHGVTLMAECAKLLSKDQNIQFIFTGDGQSKSSVIELLEKLPNCTVLPSQSVQDSIRLYHEADIVLGVFGDSIKAKSVFPYKGYDSLAFGKVFVTRDSPAAREIVKHNQHAYLIRPDVQELALALQRLKGDSLLRSRLGAEARAHYSSNYSLARIAEKIESILNNMLQQKVKCFK